MKLLRSRGSPPLALRPVALVARRKASRTKLDTSATNCGAAEQKPWPIGNDAVPTDLCTRTSAHRRGLSTISRAAGKPEPARPMDVPVRSAAAARVIDDGSVLPFYELGLTAAAAARNRELVLTRTACGPGGKGARAAAPRFLRWCAHCAERDVGRAGIASWHSRHQLLDVYVCRERGAPRRSAGHEMMRQTALPLPPTDPRTGAALQCPFRPDVAERLAASTSLMLHALRPAEWRDSLPDMLVGLLERQPWWTGAGRLDAAAVTEA